MQPTKDLWEISYNTFADPTNTTIMVSVDSNLSFVQVMQKVIDHFDGEATVVLAKNHGIVLEL
jgi:hypothetical protein